MACFHLPSVTCENCAPRAVQVLCPNCGHATGMTVWNYELNNAAAAPPQTMVFVTDTAAAVQR